MRRLPDPMSCAEIQRARDELADEVRRIRRGLRLGGGPGTITSVRKSFDRSDLRQLKLWRGVSNDY